jgi:glycosyltransferase 2 family protein
LKNKRSYRKIIFSILRIAIPAGLLTFIFLHIDVQKLGQVFTKVNPWYFALSVLLMNIMQVITAGIRWYYMIRKVLRIEKMTRYIGVYWTAMFYGYFVPSNVGMDVYRVAIAGKKQKNYSQHIAVLLGEKVYTLVITIVLMFLGFIMVRSQLERTDLAYAVRILAIGLTVLLASGLIFYLFLRKRFSGIVELGKKKLHLYATRILSKLGSKIPFDLTAFRDELRYVAGKEFFSFTFIFTLLLRLLLVAGGFFLFLSFGISLSFWALLFANTLFFIIFILPISFGSLGIREGAYIVVYGLFGVDPETALAASFLALAGLMLTVAIGGLINLTESVTRIKPRYGE